MNKTESPARSLFPLTNKLQPVVSKWRLGCPALGKKKENKDASQRLESDS